MELEIGAGAEEMGFHFLGNVEDLTLQALEVMIEGAIDDGGDVGELDLGPDPPESAISPSPISARRSINTR